MSCLDRLRLCENERPRMCVARCQGDRLEPKLPCPRAAAAAVIGAAGQGTRTASIDRDDMRRQQSVIEPKNEIPFTKENET